MRDDSKRWDAPTANGSAEMAEGVTLAPVQLTRQTLISGADTLARMQPKLAAWPDIVTDQSYALCLRRDRIMLVNGPVAEEGWHEDTSQAISDMSDAYAVFEISGRDAFATLKRGAELRLDVPSVSVARMLFGLDVFLYRFGDEDRFRIHVSQSQAEPLLKSLKASVPSP